MKRLPTKIMSALAIVLLFAYIGYNLYLNSVNNIYTQYAVMITENTTADADCIVIRDEVRGSNSDNKALIRNNKEGVYIPYVKDGSRVAAGDTIALFFKSANDAKIYMQKQELEKELEYYEQLQNQALLSYLDIDRLDATINNELDELIFKIESNDFTEISENFETLKYNISSRQIATGEKLDFSKQIKQLKKEIKNLSGSGINFSKITADFPGCFISSIDGYEGVTDYGKLEGISVAEAEKLVNSEPKKVGSSVIGKIVGEYNWYAVCSIPSTSIENLYVGKTVKASFENTDVSDIPMKVKSISEVSDSKVGVILQSNLMNEDIAALRKEKISIVLDSFEGLKVPNEALVETEKEEDGKTVKKIGVYVLNGQLVRFREVDALLYEDEYVVARNGSSASGEITLNDMIITKGRDLYDGKIIT